MSTLAALVTPPGVAAIAVVQIVGPNSIDVLEKIFRPHQSDRLGDCTAERLIYGTVYENEDVIDKVIVACDPEKQIVDINCHGGPRVVQRLLLLLRKHDVQITTWRQLHPADSIADEVAQTLPCAKTTLVVRAIAAQHPGGLTAWCQAAINTLANDSKSLLQLKGEIGRLLGTFRLAQRFLTPPTVVLVGPVNVGKSTLANALTGKTQSLVADMPGVTRDWTSQLTEVGGLAINLIDTAGRRESSDQIEQQALARADDMIERADLVILTVEADGNVEAQVDELSAELPAFTDIIIVVNKIDLHPNLPDRDDFIYISALKETNLDHLRLAICSHFGLAHYNPADPLVFTDRQYQIFLAAAADSSQTVITHLKELLG
ncbi:GTP-binding protein [Planctomycetota bacterium]